MKKFVSIILCSALFNSLAYACYNPSYLASQREEKKLQEFKEIQACSERQQYMLGDWKCMREELENEGVVISSTYTCDVLGNVAGGKQQAGRYDHSLGWDINFDLEKFVNMVGTQFHISGLWRQGQNLSTTIGNDIVVSTIFGHEQFRFYSLYLEKTFLDKKVDLKVGRIAAGDDFAASPLYGIFVSNGIDGVPISIPINLFFTVYPTATWGARARIDLNKDFYTLSGIYDGDPGVERDCMYGLDFSLRLKKGLAFAQEIACAPNSGKGFNGMPGHYKAGIYYNGAVKKDLYSKDKKHIGDYNIYFHVDQMIYREKGTSDQGLTPLAVATIGPDSINKFPFFVMGGLVYKGLVPDRDNDTTAFELIYAQYSDHLRRAQRDAGLSTQKYEMVLEFTHKIMITKWMYLQPDLQYIIQPGGTGDVDNALVIGTQFGLTF